MIRFGSVAKQSKSMQNSDQALPVKDRRPDALGDLKIIPDEIICSMLEHLTPRDVGRLACVSRFCFILFISVSVITSNSFIKNKNYF